MHQITVVGTGYVGLVTGAMMADFGSAVICHDISKEKISTLQKGEIPIYEPGLKDVVERNTYYKRLSFTERQEIAYADSDFIFIAVGTPSLDSGEVNMNQVTDVAKAIGQHITKDTVVLLKSTVPVGTAKAVNSLIQDELTKRRLNLSVDIVSNPEFLREGSALYDFTHPDRVVIGSDNPTAVEKVKSIYRILYLNETPFEITDNETAELIKYASNAFLAMKITFINEMANLCDAVGADVQKIAAAMGKDGRISPKFLHAGPGYGGSCFPKDTRALAQIGKLHGAPLKLVEQTIESNEQQKQQMFKKISQAFKGQLADKSLAVLGFTFKPKTDDLREAPALDVMEMILEAGAVLQVYDPMGDITKSKLLPAWQDQITLAADEYDAAEKADGLVIFTEWHPFRNLDLARINTLMRDYHFFDLRNLYQPDHVKANGLLYYGVGQR